MTRDEILNMPAGREMDWAIQEKVIKKPISRWMNYPPQYSTEIEDAWEVVEKMDSELRLHEIMKGSSIHEWQAEFHEPGTKNEMVRADTAPLAICRAALLAVMEE